MDYRVPKNLTESQRYHLTLGQQEGAKKKNVLTIQMSLLLVGGLLAFMSMRNN